MYKDLGNKVKLLRITNQLTQDELGKVLNLSRSQISNLEKGKRNLSLTQLIKLCEFFKLDLSYFIMIESKDSFIDLIERIRLIFTSNKLTTKEKENLYESISKIYLETKNK